MQKEALNKEVHELQMDGVRQSSLLVKVGEIQDKASFAELFEYFAPRVKAYMFKMGCSDSMAEEMAQRTMLQIWNKAKLYDPVKAAASTWIFRVARNLYIDEVRRETRFDYNDHDFALIPDTSDDPEISAQKNQSGVIIREALSELSEDQNEIINLSFYQGLSHSKISEKLNIPLGTVKSRVRLAFKNLKEKVGEAL